MIKYFITLCLALSPLLSEAKVQKESTTQNKKDAFSTLKQEQQLQFEFLFLEGMKSKVMGDYQTAVQYFDNCLKIFPQSSVVKYELASLLLANKDLNTSLDLIRQAVNENPMNIWYKLLLANIYQKKSMIEQAGEVYADIISKYPNQEDLYMVEASMYINVENWEKAIDVFNRYEQQFGATEATALEKIRLYTQMKDLKKATEELTKLMNRYPEKSEYLGILAELYLNNGQEKKGIKTIEKLMKENPSNALVQFYLSDYYLSKKDKDNFLKYTDQAMENDKVAPDAKVQYVLKLIVMSDTTMIKDDQLEGYMDFLNKNYRDNLSVRALYSDFLKKDGKYKEAISELEFILQQDKSNYLIWEELLMLYNQVQDMDKLHGVALLCINFFPDQPLPYLLAAIEPMTKKDFKKSISFLERGVLNVPEMNKPMRAQFYAYLGDAYFSIQDTTAAYKNYDLSLANEPNNPMVLNNYAYFLSEENRELAKAEKMSAKSIDLEPNNPTFLDTYAWIMYKMKDYSQAKFYMELALEKDKDPSSVLYEHYGDILLKLGEKDKAIEMWKKALEINKEVSEELPEKIKRETSK